MLMPCKRISAAWILGFSIFAKTYQNDGQFMAVRRPKNQKLNLILMVEKESVKLKGMKSYYSCCLNSLL